MKILLVEPDLFENGAIRVSLDRARYWRQAGHELDLVVVHGAGVPSEVVVPDGLQVRHVTAKARRLRWTLLLTVLRLCVIARRADVVVAGRELGDGLLCGAIAAKVARRPFVVTVQSRVDVALRAYISPRQHALTRWALRSAQAVVCVAADLVPVMQAVGVPPERAHVVTNGVDVAAIREAGQQRDEGRPAGGRPVVLGAGRLNGQKGFDVLIRAHAIALAQGAPGHDVVVLGEGPDRESLTELAEELGVANSVHLPGFAPNPHASLARADLFVLPSRWEGYPLALVEALCLGVPSVAADCVSGPREILADGRYGELVPTEDAEALAAAVTRHLLEPDALRTRARAGLATAEDRFDPRRAADDHVAVLQTVVQGAGRRRARPVKEGSAPAA